MKNKELGRDVKVLTLGFFRCRSWTSESGKCVFRDPSTDVLQQSKDSVRKQERTGPGHNPFPEVIPSFQLHFGPSFHYLALLGWSLPRPTWDFQGVWTDSILGKDSDRNTLVHPCAEVSQGCSCAFCSSDQQQKDLRSPASAMGVAGEAPCLFLNIVLYVTGNMIATMLKTSLML